MNWRSIAMVAWLAACGGGATDSGDSAGETGSSSDTGSAGDDTGSAGDDTGVAAGELTCDVLESDSYCWKDAMKALHGCMGTNSFDEAGVLAADRRSCALANGHTAVFARPVPTELEADEPFVPFEITTPDDAVCGSYRNDGEDGAKDLTITVGESTWRVEGDSGSYTMFCADGTVWRTDQPTDLLRCSFSHAEGSSHGYSERTVQFQFSGARPGERPGMYCERPG